MANMLLAANLFRRGDAQPLTNRLVLAMTPEREIDLLLGMGSAWSVFNSGQLGLPVAWALTNRVAVAFGTNPPGLSAVPDAAPPSGLQETQWRQSGTNRFVTIHTPRTRAAIGYLGNQSLSLGELTVAAAPKQLPFSSFGATFDPRICLHQRHLPLVASGWIENTGMHWKDATKTSVGDQWGSSPTLIEFFRLTLPVSSNRVQAWVLDQRGQRQASISILAPNANTSVLVPPAGAGTLWYEVQVSGPTTTAFEDWRRSQFSAEELSDPLFSGPSASPAGDGVPNLTKYALGLPAKIAVTSRDLTTWACEIPRRAPSSGSPIAHQHRQRHRGDHDLNHAGDVADHRVPAARKP